MKRGVSVEGIEHAGKGAAAQKEHRAEPARWRLWSAGGLLLFLLFCLATATTASTPPSHWRLAVHQSVVTERLVDIGFAREEARSAVEALSPAQLAEISASVGINRPWAVVVSLLCFFLFLIPPATIVSLWL
jgi:hypothetical protein